MSAAPQSLLDLLTNSNLHVVRPLLPALQLPIVSNTRALPQGSTTKSFKVLSATPNLSYGPSSSCHSTFLPVLVSHLSISLPTPSTTSTFISFASHCTQIHWHCAHPATLTQPQALSVWLHSNLPDFMNTGIDGFLLPHRSISLC